MTTPIGLPEMLAKIEQAMGQARQVTRELHEATKDAKKALQDAKEAMAEARNLEEAVRKAINEALDKPIVEAIHERAEILLAQFALALRERQNEVEKQVTNRFADMVEGILGAKGDGPRVETMLAAYVERERSRP